jgi:hypothetical protein
VFVSTGAGAVGSIVVQLAKLDGLKVIASTGSAEKLEFLKGIGADVAFNYKIDSVKDVLAKEGPIDMYVFSIRAADELTRYRYWDNVGGETLEAALDHASIGARFIVSVLNLSLPFTSHGFVKECGMTSHYNSTDVGIKVRIFLPRHIFHRPLST